MKLEDLKVEYVNMSKINFPTAQKEVMKYVLVGSCSCTNHLMTVNTYYYKKLFACFQHSIIIYKNCFTFYPTIIQVLFPH